METSFKLDLIRATCNQNITALSSENSTSPII